MKPNNFNNDISDEALLRMADQSAVSADGEISGAGTDEFRTLFSRITRVKDGIVPSEAFTAKLISSLPAVSSGGALPTVPIKSPYGERFAWLTTSVVSSWKVAAPIAVFLLMFGIVIDRNAHNNAEPQTPVAKMAMQMDTFTPAMAPAGDAAQIQAENANSAVAPRMMMTKAAAPTPTPPTPIPKSSSAVIAMLSNEADSDAAGNSSQDVDLLSIDPTSVNDLKQTYDATTN